MALVHNNLGYNLLNGCCHEAERAERVAVGLEGLRQALAETLHPHLTGLINEIYTTCRSLRDLADQSQVHMARVSVVTEYINILLPCLSRTLIDIEAHYSDKTITRERRWRKMYFEMGNELPGTTLPARFIMYYQFLQLLRLLLTKSPNFDMNALESTRSRILQLREARNIPPPSPIRHSPTMWQELEYWEEETNSHWAESIFTRPMPTQTKLDKSKNPFSQALGPFERLGQPVVSDEAKILVKRSFDNDRLSVTFFLQSYDDAPFVLIRTIQNGQPWVCLRGAHELCISRHDNATLNFTRWSRTEGCSKLWASLKFITWEEMVLFYCTFVCLKARSVRMVDIHPREYVMRKEERLFQATIRDDGFTHSLAVYQDSYTGRHRLHASVCDIDLKGCPVWTAFLNISVGKPIGRWLKRKSRYQVWVRDIQPYIFCENYRAHSQRKGKVGAFELFFLNEQAASRFMEVFDRPESSVGANESDKANVKSGRG